jgi:hypothetical protein
VFENYSDRTVLQENLSPFETPFQDGPDVSLLFGGDTGHDVNHF